MKLNCDLGESYGPWKMADDASIMPYIDMANIACGFHAGDPVAMKNAIASAVEHGVSMGAHPGYPDLQGFGRRSMKVESEALVQLLHYQIAALDGMAQCQGGEISYVKPHGALYNDMMGQGAVFSDVLNAMAQYHRDIPLLIQSTSANLERRDAAAQMGVTLWFEAFADRRYQPDGSLVPRGQSGAVLSLDEMLKQVEQLVEQGTVTATNGQALAVEADTLCVHGDSPQALDALVQIRQHIQQ